MTKLFLYLSLVLLPLTASGWSGPITSPELNTSSELKPGEEKEYSKLLEFMRSDLKFVWGRFSGPYSTQFTLSGSMENALTCIRMIRDLGLWELVVLTDDLGQKELALSISQNESTTLAVTINSGLEDFQRADFAALLKETTAPAPKIDLHPRLPLPPDHVS